ncbi:hypothetical protein GCM10023213_03690 [Prosthecobacter algae]|uniref:Uncharacterized protein n=1 Tax=Prosthecobacter algae TaxID=1144682 RepID=A0ABP9NUC8_9BACT
MVTAYIESKPWPEPAASGFIECEGMEEIDWESSAMNDLQRAASLEYENFSK